MSPTLTLSVQGLSRFATVAGVPARATLVRWVTAALERDAELVLRLVDAREGRRLNQAYRHRDGATNVLTFTYAGSPAVRADIVLCVPVVRREARAQRKTLRDHLAHLVVHGVLHAQGWDHERQRRARAMESREVEILAVIGVPDPYRETLEPPRRK